MYIYLIDYNYNNWFYIGKTSYSLDERYKSHTHSLKKSKTLNHKIWNKSLSLGNIPEIILLEKCDENNINEVEKFWIEYFKFLGIKITNLTDGGEGVKGLIFTESHRFNLGKNRKGKGIGPNPKISQSKKGKPSPKPKGFGIGRIQSAETIQKIKDSNKGKHSDNNRNRKIRQIDKNANKILNVFNSVTEAANFINPIKYKSIRSSIESAANPKVIKQKTSCGFKWEFVD